MALIALMTAATLSNIATPGSDAYMEAAITLTLLTGVTLLLMGGFRLGFFANFLSHPVISGLLSASGVLIAASQLGSLMGLSAPGFTLLDQLAVLLKHYNDIHLMTLLIGLSALIMLLAIRRSYPRLQRWGFSPSRSQIINQNGAYPGSRAIDLA